MTTATITDLELLRTRVSGAVGRRMPEHIAPPRLGRRAARRLPAGPAAGAAGPGHRGLALPRRTAPRRRPGPVRARRPGPAAGDDQGRHDGELRRRDHRPAAHPGPGGAAPGPVLSPTRRCCSATTWSWCRAAAPGSAACSSRPRTSTPSSPPRSPAGAWPPPWPRRRPAAGGPGHRDGRRGIAGSFQRPGLRDRDPAAGPPGEPRRPACRSPRSSGGSTPPSRRTCSPTRPSWPSWPGSSGKAA